jgi:O-antigen ligase
MRVTALVNYIFFPLLLAATAFNLRYRLTGADIHLGGAELSIAPYDIFLLLILVSIIFFSKRLNLEKIKIDRVTMMAVLFVMLSSVSIINSEAVSFTLYEIVRHWKIIVLFLVARSVFQDEKSVGKFTKVAALLILFETLYAVYQLATGDITEDAQQVKELFVENGITRVTGTLRHPALLSLFTVLLLPFCVYGAVNGRSRLVYISAIVAGFVVICLTYSRTQIVLYFFVVGLCLFYFKRPNGRSILRNKKIIYTSVMFSFVIMAGAIYNLENLYARFFDAPESSTTSRLILAKIALNMFVEHPIIGVGWNNFVDVMEKYDEFGASRSFRYPAHNMYLLVMAETGVLGIASYLFLIFGVYKIHKNTMKRGVEVSVNNASAAALVSIIAILITGIQGWSFRADSIQAIIWINFGIICGLNDRVKQHA